MTGVAKHQFPHFSAAYSRMWRDAGLWLDCTLHQGLDETAAAQPDKTALITVERTYTFAQFKAESDALAAGLLGIGIRPGDIVAVMLPNWVEFCFLQIALSRIGAIIQPTHTVFREREIVNLFEFCETDAVVVPESFRDFAFADMIRSVRPQLPSLREVVIARGVAAADESILSALIEEGRGNLHRLNAIRTSADDIFYLNFTSGTEGNPKGFLHTHNTVISLMKQLVRYMAADTVMLACSPMTHSFGHFTTYYCVLGGFPMVVLDRYSPTQVLAMIERARVTMLSGTPAHLFGILRHADFGKYDTSCIKSVAVGGARSSPDLIGELKRVWGVKSANTYGMGETIVHTRTAPDDPDDKVSESVGRPVFGAQLKIVDPLDRSITMPAGGVGEICFRGPTLFVGYHNQPQKTAATRDEAGWFYTGDLGFVDDEGYLYFAGRAREVINRGGSKIYPKEIEDLLCQHPAILHSAVVGMPDERLGERVCAYIVTRDNRELELAEISEFFTEKKAMKYMYPEMLVRLDAMPMTPTGKIQKAALQKDAATRAGNSQFARPPA
ncbi:class I adenylate-forming enzyme family protein [Steroidobacter denitrificans]|uniref:class I adenylate-forming enzyme family protein n=1 Tax=Steroidobacter denitrificans TaxID=465721 RepID=UPI000AEC345A|nr:AMP-binding protein [Steroidobacter denitrificans]